MTAPDVAPGSSGRLDAQRPSWISEHAAAVAPPLVPELRIWIADDLTGLWEGLERDGGTTNTAPPFWACAWPGGQALARYVLDHPSIVTGRVVLDFGAGSGLVAIAAALAGARTSIANDVDPLARAAILENAAMNGLAVTVDGADRIEGSLAGIDVVVAGDVCYERAMAERITEWLVRAAGRGAKVLLGDPGRTYAPRSGLVERARYVVPTSRSVEDRDQRETSVWEVVPR